MEKVLITGTSCGVGKATAKKFLDKGYFVAGLDWKPATIAHENYSHYDCDVSNEDQLPDVHDISYIVNNAGIVTPKADAIAVNQLGYINVLKKYGYDPKLKSVVNVGSTASIKGYDNLENFRTLIAERNEELLDTIDNECKHFATVRDLL